MPRLLQACPEQDYWEPCLNSVSSCEFIKIPQKQQFPNSQTVYVLDLLGQLSSEAFPAEPHRTDVSSGSFASQAPSSLAELTGHSFHPTDSPSFRFVHV